jgi:hypothetical protein
MGHVVFNSKRFFLFLHVMKASMEYEAWTVAEFTQSIDAGLGFRV